MSWITRGLNVFRRDHLADEIDEELRSHLDEAAAHGRSPEEARRAFGTPLRYREQSRDVRLLPWLDALLSDVVFGWRQLIKHRAASGAAIQLVLVESALLAMAASAAGMLFASWSAPLVVSMLAPPEDPVRLVLDVDWRAVGVGSCWRSASRFCSASLRRFARRRCVR